MYFLYRCILKAVIRPRFVIGIDEAGRGPLAGPVAVGAVLMPLAYNSWEHWAHLRDSKKLSPGKRARWFSYLQGESIDVSFDALPHFTHLRFGVGMVDAHSIDRQGIVPAIRQAMDTALAQVSARCDQAISLEDTIVLLDGGLHAPADFMHQQTIIKGDESEPVIALASIAAKETRDAHMEQLAIYHPEYGFDAHKGYGTKRHIEALRVHGLRSSVHRASFCGSFV